MTSNKNSATAKAADATEVTEAEASVPQQNTGEKVTILKGRSEDGKDAIIISPEDEEQTGVVDKFKSLIRNKKVLAGLGTVAAIAVFALVKGLAADSTVETVDEPTTDEDVSSSDTE
jgi:hypothetical protein